MDRINKSVLDNGIRIITRQMPEMRSVAMGVWVGVGARDEKPEQNGLSHFIEHMLFKGTQKRSALQIAKEFDAIGGQTNAFTTMETTCYHARVLGGQVETMVEILSDIFFNSCFSSLEMKKELPVICQEIGMVEDYPEDFIHLLNNRSFWGDDPLGRSILGTRENISAFNSETLFSFFNQYYQPERIVLSAAGNLDHEQLVDLLAGGFSKVTPRKVIPKRNTPTPFSSITVHPRELEQTHICLAAPGMGITDSRRYAFSLMNTVFGGNMSSRLFQEIREKRGLAYSVYSFNSAFSDTGMFGTYVATHPDKTVETVNLVYREMENLMATPLTFDELKDAKEYTRGNILLGAESVENQMVRLAQNEIHFNRHIPLSETLDMFEKVTQQDIQELANSLFRKNRMALTILGPVKKDLKIKPFLEQ